MAPPHAVAGGPGIPGAVGYSTFSPGQPVPQILGGVAAGGTSRVAAPPVTALDPKAPGNSMAANGQKVAVEAVQHTPDGPNIDLAITPADNTSQQTSGGFTHEEELFRMKWGWEDYALSLRAAGDASKLPNP